MAIVATVEALAILLLGVLVVGLLRSHAEILKSLHELGAGLELDGGAGPRGPVDVDLEVQPGVVRPRSASPADRGRHDPSHGHDVAGVDLDDVATGVAVVGAQHDTLLAFLSSGCVTCEAFWSAFGGPIDVPGGARLVVVTKDADEESPSRLRRLAPATTPVVLSTAAWDDYDVPGSPYFVYVEGSTGRIVGEGSATGWPQVADLMAQAVDDARQRQGPGQAHRSGNGAFRETRDDAALAAAGIGPGHPSLYADPDSGHDAGAGDR